MLPNICRFCEHSNPEGAKFCTECGGCLHLLPCPSCGAVTDVSARTCYQCQRQLPWHSEAAAAPPTPVVTEAKPVQRWRAPAIFGAAVVVLLAVVGYFGYRQHFEANMLRPPAAGSAAEVPGADSSPASASTPIRPASVRQDATAGRTAPADKRPQATMVVPAPPVAAPVANVPATNRVPAAPRAAIAGAAPVAGSATIKGPDAREQPSPPAAGCTPAVAALSLCTPATPPVTHTLRR